MEVTPISMVRTVQRVRPHRRTLAFRSCESARLSIETMNRKRHAKSNELQLELTNKPPDEDKNNQDNEAQGYRNYG